MANLKVICPNCGTEMNHHADKVIYAAEPSEAARIDPALGDAVEQIHNCPACGAIATRVDE